MPLRASTGKQLRDFNLVSPLCDAQGNVVSKQNKITIMPRYTSGTTASTKTFSASSDYSDSSNHNVSGSGWSYDFKMDEMCIAPGGWYNYTYDTNSGRRGSSSSPNNGTMLNDHGNCMSLYMEIHVGNAPHPGVGNAYAHIALIINQFGAYHQYHHGGPSAVYTTPRTLFDAHTGAATNTKISGQNYGTQHYRQIFSLGEMQNASQAGCDTLRFINWGGGASSVSQCVVTGGQFIIHGRGGSNTGADY
tara:strand:+ start:115 stop:858 length:744 start_codon:yes stop_codon:yes gene_type:complete